MRKSKQILTFAVMVLSLVGIVLWQALWRRQINYYIVCAVFLVLSMLPFFISFELKKITAREVTLTATLIAIAVVSRAVFYLVPQVKPIAAVVIVSAVYIKFYIRSGVLDSLSNGGARRCWANSRVDFQGC